jgi:hypothetical protein
VTNNQTTNDQIKQLILDTVKKQKPETSKQLISLIQEHIAILPERINDLLIELENEDLLHFMKPEPPTPTSAKAYMFSPKALWYWITIIFSFATILTVFSISNSDYPLVYLRYVLGFVFVLFLPGYTFTKLLFPIKLPRIAVFLPRGQIEIGSENMETIERFALSVGLSLALLPVVGLMLNFTPWGVRLAPITLSLLALTIVFATAAVLREYQAKGQAVKSAHSS